MRILHVTQYCHACSIGGTERYILDLIQGLDAAGIENSIAWLKLGGNGESLESQGVRIETLPAPPMRVDAPTADFSQVAEKLIEKENPDYLHFHTFGLSEAALALIAKKRGLPYCFTYHSPAWTCRRETMLLYGKEQCDGEVRAWRCSACQSEERLGMGPLGGHLAAAASLVAGLVTMPLANASLRRRTAFIYDTQCYRGALHRFLQDCDLVVSCCDWSGPVLEINGAPKNSMFHCPQGVPNALGNALADASRVVSKSASKASVKEFVVGCIGRAVEVKGVHILMEGFSRTSAAHARLRIVGWEPDHADTPYSQRLRKLAEKDSRIELVPKKSFAETMAEYERLSLLGIPSVWMETGPLTLFEALAVGVPVYGSNHIGQLSLLRQRGCVVEPNTPEAWQAALENAFDKHKSGLWGKEIDRARGDGKIRTMKDVTSEMIPKYSRARRIGSQSKNLAMVG